MPTTFMACDGEITWDNNDRHSACSTDFYVQELETMPDDATVYFMVCDGEITWDNNQRHSACSTDFYASLVPTPDDGGGGGGGGVGNGPFSIDPIEAAGFLGAGFFLLLPLWAALIGGRYVIKSI